MQSPEQVAAMIAHHPTLQLEWMWTMKTGTPPRPFGEYDHKTLHALLVHQKDTLHELERMSREWSGEDEEAWMREQERTAGEKMPSVKRIPRKVDYDQPVQTGDPVADEWEKAIARGEDPDFDASGDERDYR
jgi:hypothetical protein